MDAGRIVAWLVVAVTFLTPVNWIWLQVSNEMPKGSTIGELLIAILISWSICAMLTFFLIVSGRRMKAQKIKKEKELQEWLAQPVTAIKPSKALIRPGETAYGAVFASLREMHTVGYSGGTAGMSVRIAKGVTVRTGGLRAAPIKDMVSVAEGELVVTDQRIIFAGDFKGFAIPIEKLLNTTNFSDGFGFNDDKMTRILTTHNENGRLRFALALNKVLRPE